MSDWLRADPEALAAAAQQVQGHAEDVQFGHASADSRIEAAQAGLVGLSSVSLQAKLAQWWVKSEALYTRIYGHSAGLGMCASGFAESEEIRAQALQMLAPPPVQD
jgi:uncharacterized protein YukE